MPFYPLGAEVVGIDLSPQMLAQARKRKARLRVATVLRHMDVRATDFPDSHFKYVICTFLFCVLDEEDQLPALRELRRVCRANGEIRILDYTYSRHPLKRFVMRLWAPWVRLLYGATFDRHTERYIEAAGLKVVDEHFLFQDIIKLLVLRPAFADAPDEALDLRHRSGRGIDVGLP
jgi:ubiquinone/menaquinone biosynthesis C-methylase UbiE